MTDDRHEQDPHITAQLVRHLAEVEPLRERYGVLIRKEPAPGSPASADLAGPRYVADLPWVLSTQAWVVASDHALTWHALLTEAHAQPMRAHGTLLRGVIENAVITRYLVDPAADQGERFRRAAAFQLLDHRERAKFERSTGIDTVAARPPAKHAADRAKDLIAEMHRLGIAKVEPPKYTTLCGRYSAGEWIYQLLSAFAHGKPWALMVSELSEVVDVPDRPWSRGGLVTANDTLSLSATVHAMKALKEALSDLYRYVGRSS